MGGGVKVVGKDRGSGAGTGGTLEDSRREVASLWEQDLGWWQGP